MTSNSKIAQPSGSSIGLTPGPERRVRSAGSERLARILITMGAVFACMLLATPLTLFILCDQTGGRPPELKAPSLKLPQLPQVQASQLKLPQLPVPQLQTPQLSLSLNHLVDEAKTFIASSLPSEPAPAEVPAAPNTASVPFDDLKLMDRASSELLDQISKNPSDPSLHNRVALMYASLGDFDAASEHFQKAVDLSRLAITALQEKEKEARARFDYPRAAKILVEMTRINVELSAAHGSLARVYDQMGKHEKVLAQLDQLNGDIAFGAAAKKQESPQVAAGQDATANKDASHVNIAGMKSLARAQALMQAHRLPEAIQEYRNYLSIDPDSALAHEQIGEAALSLNDPITATHELEAATRLAPNKTTTHNRLGLAFLYIGETDRAQGEFEKVLALNPRDPDAPFNLGTILSQRGQYPAAQDAFQKAVNNNPRSSLAHNHLATMLSFAGDYRGAVAEFQQALQLADLASSHYGLGMALYNLKEYPASIREFKRALALNPGLSDAQARIEAAYRKSGLASASRTN